MPVNSAFGKDGEGIGAPAGGSGMRGWLSGIFQRLGEALTFKRIADVSVKGELAALNEELKLAVPQGMTMVTFVGKGVFTASSVVISVTFDGGATWFNLFGQTTTSPGAGTATALSNSGTPVAWQATLPAGVTHVRAQMTLHGTGAVEAELALGSSSYETVIGGTVTVTLGSSVIGATFDPGIWADVSSAPLAKEASVSSAGFDLTGVASGTAFTSASTGVAELRGSATADVAGTLWLEVSRDNITFKKVKKVALAQEVGGEFYGEIIHKPSSRFAKFTLVNGAVAAQTFLAFEVIRLGSL